MRRPALLAALAAAMCLAAASDPAERLPDPAQEARARDLFRTLRCVVCQNESIDDSDAELAGDLRRIVRRQVSAGRSDDQIRQFLVARYGQFILLKPPFSPGNALLWLAPLMIVLGGGGLLVWQARKGGAETPSLTADEERRVAALMATVPPHSSLNNERTSDQKTS